MEESPVTTQDKNDLRLWAEQIRMVIEFIMQHIRLSDVEESNEVFVYNIGSVKQWRTVKMFSTDKLIMYMEGSKALLDSLKLFGVEESKGLWDIQMIRSYRKEDSFDYRIIWSDATENVLVYSNVEKVTLDPLYVARIRQTLPVFVAWMLNDFRKLRTLRTKKLESQLRLK